MEINHGIILILITFYEFGDVKDLTDVKYHFEDTVIVVTLYYRTGLQLLELPPSQVWVFVLIVNAHMTYQIQRLRGL